MYAMRIIYTSFVITDVNVPLLSNTERTPILLF